MINILIIRTPTLVCARGCCGSAKPLVSDPDVIVNITANPLLEKDVNVDSASLNISETNERPWCSIKQMPSTSFDPFITIEFNSTYLIEMIDISGDPSNSGKQYVTKFYVMNDTGQGFSFIGNPENPRVREF